MTEGSGSDDLVALTAGIISAYVAKHPVVRDMLPGLIAGVHEALRTAAGRTAGDVAPEPAVRRPAVPVRKSLHEDHLVCLVCGRRFSSLKRHLGTCHDLTPQEYRTRYGLDPAYPMVAPDYAATRSALALGMGLGKEGARGKGPGKAGAKKGRS